MEVFISLVIGSIAGRFIGTRNPEAGICTTCNTVAGVIGGGVSWHFLNAFAGQTALASSMLVVGIFAALFGMGFVVLSGKLKRSFADETSN